ncbi:uncharacterized protein J3R85_015240 [Psidium guajava]|nr:uncharacterized protein J3R85_015240 [Psidium guajava]
MVKECCCLFTVWNFGWRRATISKQRWADTLRPSPRVIGVGDDDELEVVGEANEGGRTGEVCSAGREGVDVDSNLFSNLTRASWREDRYHSKLWRRHWSAEWGKLPLPSRVTIFP